MTTCERDLHASHNLIKVVDSDLHCMSPIAMGSRSWEGKKVEAHDAHEIVTGEQRGEERDRIWNFENAAAWLWESS
jgi:hypothetical protein